MTVSEREDRERGTKSLSGSLLLCLSQITLNRYQWSMWHTAGLLSIINPWPNGKGRSIMGEVKDAVLLIIKYTFNLAGSWNVALGTLASASVWLNALASQLNQRQEGGWRKRERERGSTVEGILPFQFSFSLKCDVCLTLASSLFRWPEERSVERNRKREKKRERMNENHTARKNKEYIYSYLHICHNKSRPNSRYLLNLGEDWKACSWWVAKFVERERERA